MGHDVQQVKIQKIYLDNENPRHDPIDNEQEIIALLFGKEKVANLAKDIAKHGLSPLERIGVVAHPSQRGVYIAVEGNRRMCALKVLLDPDKAPTEAIRRTFRSLAAKMTAPITHIDVVVFDEVDDTGHWKSLRHDGQLDGVGTRPWDAKQKERASRQSGANPNLQAGMLLDYAKNRKLISKSEHDEISITTLTRFLSNPIFRDMIGLNSAKELEIAVAQDEFDRAATRFLKDAHKGGASGVTSRTTKAEREDYARKLRKQGIAPVNRLPSPAALNPRTGHLEGAPATSQKGKTRNNRNPDKRTSVVPAGFSVVLHNKVLKRVFDELRLLESGDYPFAAAYLVRATLEQTAKLYCKQFSLGHDGDLHVLISRCAEKLSKDGVRDNVIKPLRVISTNKHDRGSPDTLGSYVHGGMIPTAPELNRFWDSIEEPLKLLMDQLK